MEVPGGYRYLIDFCGQQPIGIKNHVIVHLSIAARLATKELINFAIIVPASVHTEACKILPGFQKIRGHALLVVNELKRLTSFFQTVKSCVF